MFHKHRADGPTKLQWTRLTCCSDGTAVPPASAPNGLQSGGRSRAGGRQAEADVVEWQISTARWLHICKNIAAVLAHTCCTNASSRQLQSAQAASVPHLPGCLCPTGPPKPPCGSPLAARGAPRRGQAVTGGVSPSSPPACVQLLRFASQDVLLPSLLYLGPCPLDTCAHVERVV
jgi:hypothetical protein